ncbi:ABC transporter permease [Clostridium lundense]|uniref:ABC transporter permease n=1 Tax=Clostridium lundense TaxID=319475 RepID=UPI000481FF27|nr:FtsX-like permease family protein [Clostridium lundense]
MNSYKDITNKYLKHNKKRSILTICGIILSVALITSIGLFIKSMQNTYIQDAIRSYGSFHVSITDINDKDYSKINDNPKIEKIGLKEDWNKVSLKNSKGIEFIKFNKNALELLPYKAVEGNLPKAEGEIALENWVLNYMDNSPKIGENIKLKLSDGSTKEFKLTGFIKNDAYDQYRGISKGIIYSDKFNMNKATIYMTISKKADISDTIKELKKTFKKVGTNEDYIRLLGEGENKSINEALYSIAAFVIAIVVIATVAVIYNSFQISVVERIKQFGLLRAVGATPRQIRSIVLREATVMSLVGIPMGILSGVFAIFVVAQIFKMMSNSAFAQMNVDISYTILAISALVGLVSIYVSALIPARFAGKISPLVAISSRNSIVKEKIRKNRGRIFKKFLNINSLMAFKNIKRNKKRFNITVFSIVISITLFIFFSSFTNMTMNFTAKKTESDNAHFFLMGVLDKKDNSSLTEDIINKIKNNKEVKEVITNRQNYISKALISEDKKEKEPESIVPDIYSKTKFESEEMMVLNTAFDIYDDIKLDRTKSYVTAGKINKEKMVKDNEIIIVKDNLIRGKKGMYEGPLTSLKPGDSFYIYRNALIANKDNQKINNKITNFNKENMIKVKVGAVVDNAPYRSIANGQQLQIIVPKDVFKNICGRDIEKIPYASAEIVLNSEKAEQEFQKWIQPLGDNSGVSIINTIKLNEEGRTSILQIQILMYGFIAVISLIGVVNIINTITTNLILRRKEIASLSALGMTYKNIRSMILTESILYALYGCIYGGIIGTVLSYLNSYNFRSLKSFKWTIPWSHIGSAALIAILVSLISAVKPLNKIKKENIVEVIRGEE